MWSIEASSIKKGDVFIECEYGMCIRMTALEDAHEIKDETHDGIGFKAAREDGSECDYFQAYNNYGYKLRLYKEAA